MIVTSPSKELHKELTNGSGSQIRKRRKIVSTEI
jgi:hypothetical protein